MHIITRKAGNALIHQTTFKSGNTGVKKLGNYTVMSLHGTDIARQDERGQIQVNFHDYLTNVTKDRINGLCELVGRT